MVRRARAAITRKAFRLSFGLCDGDPCIQSTPSRFEYSDRFFPLLVFLLSLFFRKFFLFGSGSTRSQLLLGAVRFLNCVQLAIDFC